MKRFFTLLIALTVSSSLYARGNPNQVHTSHGSKKSPLHQEDIEISFGRGAYEPPTANGVVRPGGYEAYDPPTANGVVRPGGYEAYDPPTANGVIRPGN